jgi:hypothetical protein
MERKNFISVIIVLVLIAWAIVYFSDRQSFNKIELQESKDIKEKNSYEKNESQDNNDFIRSQLLDYQNEQLDLLNESTA